MVRTAVRVTGLSTCDVPMFNARHVLGRAGL